MCDTLSRLQVTADRIAQLDETLKAERARRDELVAAARDDGCGHSWSAIAAAGRVAPSRAHAIATGESALDLPNFQPGRNIDLMETLRTVRASA